MANTRTARTPRSTNSEAKSEKTVKAAQPVKPKRISLDDNTIVYVRSNQYGRLGFQNSRTGDFIFWPNINDVQDMTVEDIRVMRNSAPAFLQDTWVVIEGIDDPQCDDMTQEELYDALGLSRYFTTSRPRYLTDVLEWNQVEIGERVPKMSRSTRDNVTVALNTEISRGKLNDIRLIRAWESALGVELDIDLAGAGR